LCFPRYANKIAVPEVKNAAPEVRRAVRSIITGLPSGELKTIRIFITTRQAKAMEINFLFLLLVTRLKALYNLFVVIGEIVNLIIYILSYIAQFSFQACLLNPG
jgi:hypothetical protein